MILKYTLKAVWREAGCTDQSEAMHEWLEKAEESRDAQQPPRPSPRPPPLQQNPTPTATATQVDAPPPRRQCRRKAVLKYCDDRYHCRYCNDANNGNGWATVQKVNRHIAEKHSGEDGAIQDFDHDRKLCLSDPKYGPIRICNAGCTGMAVTVTAITVNPQ
jgi:hypothetical protein